MPRRDALGDASASRRLVLKGMMINKSSARDLGVV